MVQAALTSLPYDSYIVVKDSLVENYMITNPDNRFGPSIYMIPQKTYSLLKIQRGSNLQGMTLLYDTGDKSRPIGSTYEDRRSGMSTSYDFIAVPENTKVRLSAAVFSPDAQVFFMTL